MIVLMDFRRFLTFYFPVFIAGFFAVLASIAFSISLIMDEFYREGVDTYLFGVESVLALIIVHCNFMILRGRPQWVWGLVAVLVAGLLSSLSVVVQRFDHVSWFLAIVFPLLGLFVLNSKRHRKMRCKMAQVRRHREVVIKALQIIREREQGWP